MPALRTRPADVPLLASHFLTKYAQQNAKSVSGFSDEALEKLVRYPWPGNVRELENAIERAVVVCRGDKVRPEDLAPSIAVFTDSGRPSDAPPIPGSTLADIERHAILKTLEAAGGSTSKAAEILGISPRKIQYKLHEYQDTQPVSAAKDGSAQPNPAAR
jgi:DNA-binding NtrC family response regulator